MFLSIEFCWGFLWSSFTISGSIWQINKWFILNWTIQATTSTCKWSISFQYNIWCIGSFRWSYKKTCWRIFSKISERRNENWYLNQLFGTWLFGSVIPKCILFKRIYDDQWNRNGLYKCNSKSITNSKILIR